MDPDQEDLEEADVRVEKAKASLRARFHEIERRFDETKEKLDVGSKIAMNPRIAVGIAFGVGALLGTLGGSSKPRAPGERSLGAALVAALGAMAISALKDMALSEGVSMAKGWLDKSQRDPSGDVPAFKH